MGLDMYLVAKKYLWSDKDKKIKEKIEKACGISEPTSVSFEVMYWRKANAIHKWFVDNVQDGVDDCRESYVPLEKLKELLEIVTQVLNSVKLVDGKVGVGYSIVDGKMVEHFEDGKVVEDFGLAEDLLPTESGFFFGGTDYDQYYYSDLKRTQEALQDLITKVQTDDNYNCLDFYYHSSW